MLDRPLLELPKIKELEHANRRLKLIRIRIVELGIDRPDWHLSNTEKEHRVHRLRTEVHEIQSGLQRKSHGSLRKKEPDLPKMVKFHRGIPEHSARLAEVGGADCHAILGIHDIRESVPEFCFPRHDHRHSLCLHNPAHSNWEFDIGSCFISVRCNRDNKCYLNNVP